MTDLMKKAKDTLAEIERAYQAEDQVQWPEDRPFPDDALKASRRTIKALLRRIKQLEKERLTSGNT